jgi:nanoRNase/pAp phosphatase (c-di-AMP/oligoRNAs hydrolase)
MAGSSKSREKTGGRRQKSASNKKKAKRSDHFLETVDKYNEVLMVTHDNPDPDAIGAGWALVELVKKKLQKPARLVAGGAVIRAENLYLVRVLEPPIELVDRLRYTKETAIVLVDCNLRADNHLLEGGNIQPTAVIDHHEYSAADRKLAHFDIRPNLGASATIATQYFYEQQLEPNKPLATALVYALQTDTHSAEATIARGDKWAYGWLISRADLQILRDIENAPLGSDWYADLFLAMENTFVYEDAALCFLPHAVSPEIIGEVADLLIRGEHINKVFCGAAIERAILISVRTTSEGGDASRLLQKTLGKLGHGGGHRHRAGGKLYTARKNGHVSEDLQAELRSRWLGACKVDQQRGMRLVPRREILHNL